MPMEGSPWGPWEQDRSVSLWQSFVLLAQSFTCVVNQDTENNPTRSCPKLILPPGQAHGEGDGNVGAVAPNHCTVKLIHLSRQSHRLGSFTRRVLTESCPAEPGQPQGALPHAPGKHRDSHTTHLGWGIQDSGLKTQATTKHLNSPVGSR